MQCTATLHHLAISILISWFSCGAEARKQQVANNGDGDDDGAEPFRGRAPRRENEANS